MRSLIRLPTVAFDEAGNTGQNLLDPAQPVFVHASVCVPRDAAADLVARVLGKGSNELHFNRLRRSSQGRHRVLEVLNDELMGPATTKIAVLHKSFMVTAKIVDMLIEPGITAAGLDFYERGFPLALANLWYAIMPAFLGGENYRRLQELFVQMIRSRDHEDLAKFYSFVWELYCGEKDQQVRDELAMIMDSFQFAEEQREDWDLTELDPALPGFFMLARMWTAQFDTPFVVVHDHSKLLSFTRERLTPFIAWDDPISVFIDRGRLLADRACIADLSLVDSKDHPEVQLADIVASATAYRFRPDMWDDGFTEELAQTQALQHLVDSIWPDPESRSELGKEDRTSSGFDPQRRVIGVVDLHSEHPSSTASQ